MPDECPTLDRRLPLAAERTVSAPGGTVHGPDRVDLEMPSPQMRRVFELAAKVAALDLTVLITGESGVGNERLARWVHRRSHRARGPFVAVNCGALCDTLLESELFGAVRGAFTGATQDRRGLFEAAHGGTLFLDEIGDVSAAMQVKLLRVLQECEIRRVGEPTARLVNVRLIAATNRDLLEEVAQHRFRHDLYYRLRVLDLHVPPLRERPDDLQLLAQHLLARAAARLDRPVLGYTSRALDYILRYRWPGNVRELEHAIERACVVTTGSHIDVEDLAQPVTPASAQPALARDVRPLDSVEREHILTALESNHGNRTRTAAQLGISRATLTRKLRLYRRASVANRITGSQ